MIFWRASALAEALRDDRVTESQKGYYLLATTLLQLAVGRVGLVGVHHTYQTLALLATVAALTVWGLLAAFRTNQQGDGIRFVERYVCLALPLTVRFYAFYALSALLLYLLTRQSGTIGGNVWVSLLYLGWLAWFFAALRRHVAIAAGSPKLSRPPA